jgi:dTDP-L-rhamnose 4-epimerase
VLMSGGAGFIGSKVARKLLAAGHEVVIFDNLHPQVHTRGGLPADMPAEARFVPGDVTVAANWATLFRYWKPDVVLHLAAETGTGQSLTESHRHASVNVNGTALLIDALHAAKHVPRQVVITSSRAVYGDGAWQTADGQIFYPGGRSRSQLEAKLWDYVAADGRPAKALASTAGVTHPNPISVYGATKLAQEQMLRAWCLAFGAGLSVLRLQNVYGPGQNPANPYTGVLTFFVRVALQKGQLEVYEDGQIVRDFVHVEDVSQAIVKALARQGPEVITADIGSGSPITIAEIANRTATLLAAPPPKTTGRFRDGDVRAASCTIDVAQSLLGYQPQWSFDDGLRSLSEWMRRLDSGTVSA